ncbi:hypothetical protein SAMN05421788_1011129 [Filimonas lacunae]|uniref:Uncharacterized protein n=1 Tax=Filimonas lacunae TaxID=477680 RepID=A0A1N7LU21_9BACT|nr:hypothetical protein SAMN05421788_1011129 [Filimonas lacunae]
MTYKLEFTLVVILKYPSLFIYEGWKKDGL